MLRSGVLGCVARLSSACSCSPRSLLPFAAALGTKGASSTSNNVVVGSTRRASPYTTASPSERPQPTRELIDIIRENSNITTAKLWKEVQDRHETSESARAIPNKRQMKVLLKFMKKTFKVKASKGKTKSYLYRLHPLLLKKEQRMVQQQQQE